MQYWKIGTILIIGITVYTVLLYNNDIHKHNSTSTVSTATVEKADITTCADLLSNDFKKLHIIRPCNHDIFPVLLFIPGLGMAVDSYMTILQEVVQHGYIIYALDYILQNPNSISHEHELRRRASDVNAILAYIRSCNSSINLDRIGIFGHSLGGSVALTMCRTNASCIAGVNMDGGLDYGENPLAGFKKPFMFMLQDPQLEHPSALRLSLFRMSCQEYQDFMKQYLYNIKQLCTNIGKDAYSMTISHTSHSSFSDFVLTPERFSQKYDLGTIDGYRVFTIITTYLIAFFDTYLKHIPSPLFSNENCPPEVTFS